MHQLQSTFWFEIIFIFNPGTNVAAKSDVFCLLSTDIAVVVTIAIRTLGV